MRVVFCGNPEFAIPTLEALLTSTHAVAAVVSSPDKLRGRGRRLTALPVKERALAEGLKVLHPPKLKDSDFLRSIAELEPDCLVVVAFRILPRELFALPRLGSFNVHPSLLPRGRGPAPIPWTLIRGETQTGVTIIHLTERVDGGDILAQQILPIQDNDNFGTLHDKLSGMGARMLVSVLDRFERNDPPQPQTQDESLVTHAPKLFAADFELNWLLPATDIRNRIRGLSPSPGAVTNFGYTRFKILDADTTTSMQELAPGQLWTDQQHTLLVGTGDGTLRLNSVQPEGKRVMSVAEYLRGRPDLPDRFGK